MVELERELETQYYNANDYFYDSYYKSDLNENKKLKKILNYKLCHCDFNRAGKLYFRYYPSHKSVRRLRFLINLNCTKKVR